MKPHQWFYGMLGSNERRHPWMDEGWTTYLENRLYLNTQRLVSSPKESKFSQWLRLSDEPEDFLPHLRLHYLKGASRNSDPLTGAAALFYDESDYYTAAYSKPTLGIVWLEDVLGGMSSTLRCAITTGNGRSGIHSPEDLQTVFRTRFGKKLDWYFDDWTFTNAKADFALK